MVFNKDSALVKIWLEKVTNEEVEVTINDVPELFNLKEIIMSLIKE